MPGCHLKEVRGLSDPLAIGSAARNPQYNPLFARAGCVAVKELVYMFATPQRIQTEVFTEVPQALRKSSIIAERRPRALLASVATL